MPVVSVPVGLDGRDTVWPPESLDVSLVESVTLSAAPPTLSAVAPENSSVLPHEVVVAMRINISASADMSEWSLV